MAAMKKTNRHTQGWRLDEIRSSAAQSVCCNYEQTGNVKESLTDGATEEVGLKLPRMERRNGGKERARVMLIWGVCVVGGGGVAGLLEAPFRVFRRDE